MSLKHTLQRQSIVHTHICFQFSEKYFFFLPLMTIKQDSIIRDSGQGIPKITSTSPLRVLHTFASSGVLYQFYYLTMRNIFHEPSETLLKSFVVLIRRVLGPACFFNLISSLHPPTLRSPASLSTLYSLHLSAWKTQGRTSEKGGRM